MVVIPSSSSPIRIKPPSLSPSYTKTWPIALKTFAVVPFPQPLLLSSLLLLLLLIIRPRNLHPPAWVWTMSWRLHSKFSNIRNWDKKRLFAVVGKGLVTWERSQPQPKAKMPMILFWPPVAWRTGKRLCGGPLGYWSWRDERGETTNLVATLYCGSTSGFIFQCTFEYPGCWMPSLLTSRWKDLARSRLRVRLSTITTVLWSSD